MNHVDFILSITYSFASFNEMLLMYLYSHFPLFIRFE